MEMTMMALNLVKKYNKIILSRDEIIEKFKNKKNVYKRFSERKW